MNDLLTAREVAQRLRVEVSTVRRWVKTGAIEAVRLPSANRRRGYRFKSETLDKVLQGGVNADR